MCSETEYVVEDLGAGAALAVRGHLPTYVADRDGRPAFVFRHDPELTNLIAAYHARRLTVDAKTFAAAIRALNNWTAR
ncbi:MAG: DUF5659 domain-containing protein [Chloroflexota bacterium]|nr:DUF5659 domain-containing protein [Chloroflexota bacterium]